MLPVRARRSARASRPDGRAPGSSRGSGPRRSAKTLTAPRVVPGLRIPQADGYLADLTKGGSRRRRASRPSKALQGVAEAWSARTEALGAERQLWHYSRA